VILKAKFETIKVDRKPWYVIKTDKGTCKGVVNFDLTAGDMLELEGQWAENERWGSKEFCFKTAMISVPTDSRGLLEYAISQTKGLGEAALAEIWETYREEWTTAIPLTLKRAVSESVQWNWKDTLTRIAMQKQQSQAIGFVMGHKCTLAWAQAAYKEWGNETVSVVTKNPYKLADLPRYGFMLLEAGVRQTFGIEDLDPRRIEAAVMYSLGDLTGAGSTAISEEAFYDNVGKLVPDAPHLVQSAIWDLNKQGKVCYTGLGLISLGVDSANEKKIYSRWGGENEREEMEL